MIRVLVELHSAVTGKTTEIGRMEITNDGRGTAVESNYDVSLMRRGTEGVPQRRGRVEGHRREAYSVWVLVAKALKAVAMKPVVAEPDTLNDVYERIDRLQHALAKCRDAVKPDDDCPFCSHDNPCAGCYEKARISGGLAPEFALIGEAAL